MTNTMSTCHVLLIDDHDLFRTGLRLVLKSGFPQWRVSEAAHIEDALGPNREAPDLVLLDIQLHGLNGLEGLALIRRRWPRARTVVLSADQSAQAARTAVERGAAMFMSKATPAPEMLDSLAKLLGPPGNGEDAAAHDGTHPAVSADRSGRLTPRQCEVLDLLSKGLSNKAIGQKLGLTENTVRTHVQATFQALGASSRAEAAFVARSRGILR